MTEQLLDSSNRYPLMNQQSSTCMTCRVVGNVLPDTGYSGYLGKVFVHVRITPQGGKFFYVVAV